MVVVVSNRKQKGFTLIEVMISMVFLTVVLLGILQTLALYARRNVDNLIRDEAVKIAQECVENLRNGVNCANTYRKNFRNFSINYTVTYTNTSSFTSGNNPVQVIVSYTYPRGNRTYNVTINTVVHRP